MNRVILCGLVAAALVLSAIAAGLIITEFVAPTTHVVIVPLETSSG